MASVTIQIDDQVLDRAQRRASRQGTSVDGVLRACLEGYATSLDRQLEAMTRILDIARNASSRRGDQTWTRDELHER